MNGSEIKTEDVAEKIAALIVDQTYISAHDLSFKINAYLKAFVKVQSIPKFHPKDARQESILQQKRECWVANEQKRYYSSILTQIVGIEKMAKYNFEAEALRKLYKIGY